MADPAQGRPTIYIRCAALHNRGELLNGFFFAHRAALGLQHWYEAPRGHPLGELAGAEGSAVSGAGGSGDGADAARLEDVPLQLPRDFPVEVVYVRTSRKPYFLVEWRYPTGEEAERRKGADEVPGEAGAASAATHVARSVPEERRVSEEALRELGERTLALARQAAGCDGLTWKEQPVSISAALPGASVAAERRKLELRDAQLRKERLAEKRERAEPATAALTGRSGQGESTAAAPSFVPRSVRRRM